ncbi:MAG: lysophospholipid acyltransferase family protein [Pseudomonadota bacterium]
MERLPLSERAGDLVLAAAMVLVPFLPPRVGLRLGELLGRVIFRLDGRHRRLALSQIEECLGESVDVRVTARQVFENLGRLIIEMFYMARLGPEEVRDRIHFEGLRYLRHALAKGRGCLVLTGHFGAFELMPAAFSLTHGRGVNIVIRRMDWGPAHRALVALRERCGNRSVTKGRAMRQLLRLLGRQEIVGALVDQNVVASEGVFVDFFGRPACTNKGFALLALRSGAPVVPAFIVYEGRARHRIVFEPEVELARTGDRAHDVRENTARFTAVIERWVRRYPGHWFWMHRRWKTRPEAAGAGGDKDRNEQSPQAA